MGNTSVLEKPFAQSIYNKIYETQIPVILYSGGYNTTNNKFCIIYLDYDDKKINEGVKYPLEENLYGGFQIVINKNLQLKVIDIISEVNFDPVSTNGRYSVCFEIMNDVNYEDVLLFGDDTDIKNLSIGNLLVSYSDVTNNKFKLKNKKVWARIFSLSNWSFFYIKSERESIIYNNNKLKLLSD